MHPLAPSDRLFVGGFVSVLSGAFVLFGTAFLVLCVLGAVTVARLGD